jgi:putative oxidoreductase
MGRLGFSLIFILAGLNHFTAKSIALAGSHGVPLAVIAVPFSGMLALAGGLSVLLGYRAKLGAWLLVLFLIPVTLTMHKFWGLADPMMAEAQMIMFMKNISLIGGALIISQLGAGPFSLDDRRSQKWPSFYQPGMKVSFHEAAGNGKNEEKRQGIDASLRIEESFMSKR